MDFLGFLVQPQLGAALRDHAARTGATLSRLLREGIELRLAADNRPAGASSDRDRSAAATPAVPSLSRAA